MFQQFRKKSWLLLLAILIVAAFLRLYRIEDYMTFLGDEGRDALVVKRMVVDHEFTLLGPITSVGLMHLGPLYYYLMIPFLWAWGLNPVGPAIMVALFSLATIVLLWKLTEEYFGLRAAAVSSLLYALSPLVIIHSHSSWNPNILPFWSLLIIHGLMQVIIHKRFFWALIIGLSLGIVIQLHYVALVFGPVVFAALLVSRVQLPKKYWGLLVAGGLLTFSPFIIFELRHALINTHTIIDFITRTGTAKSFTIMNFFRQFWDLTVRLYWRLLVITSAELAMLVLIVVFGVCAFLWRTAKSSVQSQAYMILGIWFIVGIGFLSLYTGNIYDYYLMFIFPFPFLLTGIATSYLLRKWSTAVIALVCLTFFVTTAVKNTPIGKEPNRLATLTREVSESILEKAAGQPFNFGLITPGNSDHAYRYFLEIGGNAPVVIKNEVEDPGRTTVTGQLFVVCEQKECKPLGYPLWEIAGYGRAEITDEWYLNLVRIFKLVPYQELSM